MKAFRKILGLVLCMIVTVSCTTVSMAKVNEPDVQLVKETSGELGTNAIMPFSLQNIVTKVSVTPAYYNEAEDKWYYYNNRTVSTNKGGKDVYFEFSKDIWKGLNTQYVLATVTYTTQYACTVRPTIAFVSQEKINVDAGTHQYSFTFMPEFNYAGRIFQLYFSNGANEMCNVNINVKEWH